MKHDVNYLLGALRAIASVAKERGISDLYATAQAGIDLYDDNAEVLQDDASEIDKLKSDLAAETALKQEWIDEYVKLRDASSLPGYKRS